MLYVCIYGGKVRVEDMACGGECMNNGSKNYPSSTASGTVFFMHF